MIKKSLTFIVMMFACATLALAQNHNAANILPKPTSVVMGNKNSTFTLTPKTRIVYQWGNEDVKKAL